MKDSQKIKVVGITACATGIAHTFMAADALEKVGSSLGYSVSIEKQGADIKDQLSSEKIKNADYVIIAADVDVKGMERFAGKKVLKTKTATAIKDSESIFNRLKKDAKIEKASESTKSSGGYNPLSGFSSTTRDRWDTTPLKGFLSKLLSGVRYMLPVVIIGGIMVGIAFLIDIGIDNKGLGGTRPAAKIFSQVGGWMLTKLTPMFLGGFIARAIVGDKGLVPGFVAGLIASGIFGDWGGLLPNFEIGGQDVYSGGAQHFSDILKSGFLGGIFGGYFAGFSVWLMENIMFNIKGHFETPKNLIFIPLFSTILTALFMLGANFPLGYILYYVKIGLNKMEDLHISVIIGLIIGVMMASDMGGPVNKTASLFAIAHMIENGQSTYMAAAMCAGMIPPLVIAFSTVIYRKHVWTKDEKEAAKVNWILGAFYITEGAIPFAAKDLKRVMPSIIAASALGGVLVTAFNITITAPHGGIFVFPLLRMDKYFSGGASTGMGIVLYIASIIIPAVLGGIMLGYWKKHDMNKLGYKDVDKMLIGLADKKSKRLVGTK